MRLVLFVIFLSILINPVIACAEDVLVYAGAGLMKPMEELVQGFEQKHNLEISLHYGGSGELFGLMSMGKPCDVFIPGATRYTDKALEKGWIMEKSIKKVVKHIPVIAVPTDNPAGISSLDDLAKPGIKMALGDPKACAIGNLSVKILKNNGIYDKFRQNSKVFSPTVNQLLLYISATQVDAAIIWKDFITWKKGGKNTEMVQIDHEKNIIKAIPTAVTSNARKNKKAHLFNSYIASDNSMEIWKKWGFERCRK